MWQVFSTISTVLLSTYFLEVQSSIQCYKCQAAPPNYYTNETIRLCKDFDYSDKFIVDCPYSTFCMKKSTSAKIPLLINGTERDCANQKSELQFYKNGQWHPEIKVEEPYQEGCTKANDKGLRTSVIENCYCKGYLCNGALKTLTSSFSVILTVILVTLV